MTSIPTRWRNQIADQLEDAGRRVTYAEERLGSEEGSRALQAAYQAVVAAATVRVWLEAPPWQATVAPADMQRRVQAAFPNRFAALATLDLQDVLTSPWTGSAAKPYVEEADAFCREVAEQFGRWQEGT